LAYIGAVAKTLEARGISPEPILQSAGISYHPGSDPLERVTAHQVTQMFKSAVEATQDVYFGLSVAKFMHAGTFHALGYAMLASNNLRDFCERLSRFFRIASQGAVISTIENDEGFALIVGRISQDACYETQDALTSFLVHFMRLISPPGFNPSKIELKRPSPEMGSEPYETFFKAPVSFDGPEIRIWLTRDSVDVPLTGGNSEIARLNEEFALGYLAQIDKGDLVTQTQKMIVDQLATGRATKNQIAGRLHMSPRTLQEKLTRQNTNFQQVLDETRAGLARSYMDQNSISITEMTFLLGFSDTSNFARAFKRWTGRSPSAYRQNR
jgi:AraC-like DNA-binding protein